MSWSQSRQRKWHRDNPGKSPLSNAVRRMLRRRRKEMADNITRNNALFERLKRIHE
jgi:hypothetical protein